MRSTTDNPVSRPEFDLGEIFRQHRDVYEKSRSLSPQQRKVLHDLSVCRTSFLGGHLYECSQGCGYEQPRYNSCRNRHCPKCQGGRMMQWVQEQLKEVLPIGYFHTIFTMSHAFNDLVPYNERVLYNAIFEAASTSLDRLAKQQLKGTLGVTAVLHTWGQNLSRHIHLHCLVTGGALSLDQTRWIPCGGTSLFDVYELSRLLRELFCQRVRKLYSQNKLVLKYKTAHLSRAETFDQFMAKQESIDWVVHCKRPFAGSEKVVEYLGRYSYRVALSNRRITDVTDTQVTLDYKDYADVDSRDVPKHKEMKVAVATFMDMFLRHVLPKGFRKIRYYGILAGSKRAEKLQQCRTLIQQQTPETLNTEAAESSPEIIELTTCPDCGAPLKLQAELEPKRAGPQNAEVLNDVA